MSRNIQVGELDFDALLAREWLATNSVGGFASSSLAGLNTRRYHGLLVAALAPPARRVVLLSRVEETIRCAGREFLLACNEYPGTIWPHGHEYLRAFSNDPFPRWAYQADGWTLQKELRLLRGENTVLISYTLLGGGDGIELEIRPLMALRPMHELAYQWNGQLDAELRSTGHWRVPATRRTPEAFFAHDGRFDRRSFWYLNQIYRREGERGYAGLEDLWSPGAVHCNLKPGQTAHFACSADPIELRETIERATAQCASKHGGPTFTPLGLDRTGSAGEVELLRAADAFIVTNGQGDCTCAAPLYPWGPLSVRNALMGFTGLFLIPQRFDQARSALLSLSAYLKDGLLPSEFSEESAIPVFGGADISLWFVNAVRQHLLYTGDDATALRLLEPVLTILRSYQAGTELGISMNREGLLRSGIDGQPTTWMNAKAGDNVITPRTGFAVEINALWYNAICSAAELCRRLDRPADADALDTLAKRTKDAFNRRFWNAIGCFDCIADGGPDDSVRPNQLLAISLPFPVLSSDRHSALVQTVRSRLLMPMGVRTLAPGHRDYIGHYAGNLLARDRAYHNGSAFTWLLGPYITALVRSRGGSDTVRQEARTLLAPSLAYMQGDGLGQIPELWDGDAPHAPGGAIAAPLAVAELLRCYFEDLLARAPVLLLNPSRTTPLQKIAQLRPDLPHPA